MGTTKRYIVFIISYLLNAFGNALMVKGSVGAIVWTATFTNMASFLDITVGMATSIIMLIFYFISKIIGRDFNVKDAISCITLSYFFGTLIDFYLGIIGNNQSDNILINYVYAIVGVLIVSMSVSLTIHVDVAYLALDDFLKNLKNKVFKGNVAIASYASLGIGAILAIIFGYLNGEILNVNIFTVIASLSLGILISMFDVLFKFNKK